MTTSRTIKKSVFAQALAAYGNFHDELAPLRDNVGLCIDSRALKEGDVFLAMRGDIDDGHNYVHDVIRKGAHLIIADRARADEFKNLNSIIFVDDTLRFFGELACSHLRSLTLTTIGITGSNGKTTTKEMLKAALSHVVGAQLVYASVGNRNNLFGVPLCALEVNEQHRYAIFEMGMNQVGEMERLASIVQPNVAVITNISGAHAGNFCDGVLGIRREKGQIFKSIAHHRGHAVVNLDDEHVTGEAAAHEFASRVSFGHVPTADVNIVATAPFDVACGAQIARIACDDDVLDVAVPLAGTHHAMNAACAIAIVKALKLSPCDAAVGIQHMAKIAGRMSVTTIGCGALMIDDGYNANPVSMAAGIKASHEFDSARRIAVIGAMGELGPLSAELHRKLGALLAANFDYLFICGDDAYETVVGAHEAGFEKDHIVYRSTSNELIVPLQIFLQRGDLIFVKGSLSSNMQAIVKALV